jgi:hypothetical protein
MQQVYLVSFDRHRVGDRLGDGLGISVTRVINDYNPHFFDPL